MLFQVEMDVRLPHDFPAEKAEALKQTERARAQELQRAGIWRHLWRVAGRYSDVHIFELSRPPDLPAIPSHFSLLSFLVMTITSPPRSPSSVPAQDRQHFT